VKEYRRSVAASRRLAGFDSIHPQNDTAAAAAREQQQGRSPTPAPRMQSYLLAREECRRLGGVS